MNAPITRAPQMLPDGRVEGVFKGVRFIREPTARDVKRMRLDAGVIVVPRHGRRYRSVVPNGGIARA